MAQGQFTGQTPRTHPGPVQISLDEYLELLDTAPYEIIDGELIPMAPQAMSSNDAAHMLYDTLRPYVRQHHLGRMRMEAAFALDMDAESSWVIGSLVPDVAFVSTAKIHEQKEKFPGVNGFRVPPDLAVEVVSPTDAYSAVAKKVRRYLSYGVRAVWVIDPQNQNVRIFSADQPDGKGLDAAEILSDENLFPGWSMPVADLFRDDDED